MHARKGNRAVLTRGDETGIIDDVERHHQRNIDPLE
jgi:hypothetical protein